MRSKASKNETSCKVRVNKHMFNRVTSVENLSAQDPQTRMESPLERATGGRALEQSRFPWKQKDEGNVQKKG